jgi:hypothetical protein
MSIVAPVLGLVASIFLFFMLILPASLDVAPLTRVLLSLLGLIVALIALAASVYAVWQVDSQRGRGGRGLAMSGVAFGLASALWSIGVLVTLALRAMHT